MELTNWRELSDRGPDLVLCLDFPGGRAAAGFAELAAGISTEAAFVHSAPAGAGPLDAAVDRWVGEALGTGRPVRAVLGYCFGTMLAIRVADALADAGAPPVVLLFDAMAVTAGKLAEQFGAALEASGEHLTADELAGAGALAENLVQGYPDDLPRVAAGLTEEYDRLMGAVARRLLLNEIFRKELTGGFTTYLDYLLLAAEAGFHAHSTDPLFLYTAGREPPVDGARTMPLTVSHADLLRDPEVHTLVADLLNGAR